MKEKIFIFLLIFCFISAGFMPANVEKVGIVGTATADYVDASNNTSCIEEDPLVPGWSKDVRLTNTSGHSNHPDVAIDLEGNIHIVWMEEEEDDYCVYYRKSMDGGNSWSKIRKIDEGYTTAQPGFIAIDDDNTIYVVYDKYDNPGDYDIWYATSTDHGDTWSKSGLVDTACISTSPKIAIRGNALHIVWNDKRDNGTFQVYYKESINKGLSWSEDKQVTNTTDGCSMPFLAADSNNVVHIVYQKAIGDEYETCYTNSKDGGDSWLETKIIAESSPGCREPVIITDSFGTLHAVWTDNRARKKGWDDICYKKSADGGITWGNDMDVSGHTDPNTTMPKGRSFMPAITIDSFDNIFVVYKCSNFTYENGSLVRTNNDIYYRCYNIAKSKWSNITRITYAFDGGRIYPGVTIDNQSVLHMVWGDNRASHSGNMEIYYKRSLYPVSEKPITVTQSLNQSTCKPGNSITVSGNAVYNDFVVPNANVSIKIVETGEEWNTTTDLNGDYSVPIIAPDTPGNYTIRVTVTSGNHTGWKIMRLTVEQESTNGGTTNGGTTNGGQQPDGEENKYGFNLNYVIAIVGVIAACTILGVVLVKHKGKQSAKLKEEKKPTQMLRCPKCKKTFRVEIKSKPFNVKCPYCGKEGTIK